MNCTSTKLDYVAYLQLSLSVLKTIDDPAFSICFVFFSTTTSVKEKQFKDQEVIHTIVAPVSRVSSSIFFYHYLASTSTAQVSTQYSGTGEMSRLGYSTLYITNVHMSMYFSADKKEKLTWMSYINSFHGPRFFLILFLSSSPQFLSSSSSSLLQK